MFAENNQRFCLTVWVLRCPKNSQMEMSSVQPDAGSRGRKLGPLTKAEKGEREGVLKRASGQVRIVEWRDKEDVATKRLMVERKEAIWPKNQAPDPYISPFLAATNPEGRHQLLKVNAELPWRMKSQCLLSRV